MKNPHPILVFNVASYGTVLHCVSPHNQGMKVADSDLILLPLVHQPLETK